MRAPDGPSRASEIHAVKVHVVQPALPAYRIDFFDRVADRLGSDFTVYYSPQDMGALTAEASQHRWAQPIGRIKRVAPGLNWQRGTLSFPIARGDIVVVSGAPRELSNLALLHRARRVGARTVWWGQYWSASSRRWRFLLRSRLMRAADALLFYTDAEVSAYHEARSGRHEQRIVMALNNGIDTVPVAEHRARYIAAGRPRSLLFIGRLTTKSDFGLLLEALSRPELSDIRLEVVGDCPGQPEDESFKTRARELGLDARITWNGSTTDEAKIAAVANRTSLFVYPGAVGLSLIHAMAYGLPAVLHADRLRHMPEIAAFEDKVTGRAFARGDADSLAETLATCLGDQTARDAWSAACIERTEVSYNTRSMAERFGELLERLRS